MGLVYRLRQGLGRMQVSLCPQALDLGPAREALPAELWPLFAEMPRGDQWHGLCVLARLQRAGWDQPDLLAAALLHDVGKAKGRLSLPCRTMIILAKAMGLGWITRLAVNKPHSWRYPFYVHLHHAALGAERLQEAGASATLISLVSAHEDASQLPPVLVALGRALIAADDAC